jgi:hypothetical protein
MTSPFVRIASSILGSMVVVAAAYIILEVGVWHLRKAILKNRMENRPHQQTGASAVFLGVLATVFGLALSVWGAFLVLAGIFRP